MSPVPTDGSMDPMARLACPGSVTSLATTRAVSPAAMTLTRPPAGSPPRASVAARRAASRRSSGTSVADIEADASTTRTRSCASAAGRSSAGRTTAATSSSAHSSCSSSSSERRSRCHGEFASTSRTRCCHRKVELTSRSGRRSLSIQRATMTGSAIEPDEPERRQQRHVDPTRAYATTRRRRSSANTRSASGSELDTGTYAAPRRWHMLASPSCHAASRSRYASRVPRSTVTSTDPPLSRSTSRRSPSSGGSSSSSDRTWITDSSQRVPASSLMARSAPGSNRSDTSTIGPRWVTWAA